MPKINLLGTLWFDLLWKWGSSTQSLGIFRNVIYTPLYIQMNVTKIQKQHKFSKFLKNAQHWNPKQVLELVLVTHSKTGLGFSCLAPEVQFLGYPKMPKINLLGTQKIVHIVLNTKIWDQRPEGRGGASKEGPKWFFWECSFHQTVNRETVIPTHKK